MTVIPEGTPVTGNVVAAQRAGKVKGRSSLAIRFNSVTVANKAYRISTARISSVGEATKSEDATKIGIGAGAGAIIGGIAGGKKGAAIGAGVGGGAGTGAVLATRGKEVSDSRGRDSADDRAGDGQSQRADVGCVGGVGRVGIVGIVGPRARLDVSFQGASDNRCAC